MDDEGVGNRELRFGRQPSVRFGFVRERGREKAVGPVFGVAAGVGEDDRDDNDCGEREFGEPLELEGEAAVGERTREVLETLALDGGEQSPVSGVDCVVASGDGLAHRGGALLGEAVGVALAGIDRDRDRLGEGASARDAAARVGGPGGLLRLPEDRFASFDLGEDELGARLPGPVEDEIDRWPTLAADERGSLVDDLCVFWPWFFEAVAVDACGRRPGRPRLQYEAISKRQPDEVGQPAVCLRVPRDQEPRRVAHRASAHAATATPYSWISPPSTSRRRTAGGGEPRAAGG